MDEGLSYSEKTCPYCGKGFIVNSPSDWVFKRNFHGADRMFCSWSCVRAWDVKRGTKAERRERIIAALNEGMDVDEICKKLEVDRSNVVYWKNKLGGKDDG